MTYATILVNLEAGRSNAHLLDVAMQVAERFQAGVIGSTACSPIQAVYADGYAYGDVLEQDSKAIEQDMDAAQAEFRAAFGANDRFLDWRSAVVEPSLAGHLAQEASRSDLVLTQAGTPDTRHPNRAVSVGDLIMQAGRPVLLVAPAATPFRMDRVLIGWKNTREARRAVTDALPLLKQASHVDIVEIAPQQELGAAQCRLDALAAWLGRHGIAAERHTIPAFGDDAGSFEAVVVEREADIVVAGAYGHSRVREWALGGITRTLLQHPGRSSLLSH